MVEQNQRKDKVECLMEVQLLGDVKEVIDEM